MALPLYYNWRNLLRRRLSTTLTFVVVAAVVFVLSVLLSFATGIREALDASGSPRNVLVLKPGATAESMSMILPDEVGRLVQTPGIARGADGQPLLSRELCVQTTIPRRDGTAANIAVRGVDDIVLAVHDNVRIIEGRSPQAGALEAMTGKAARDRYPNLDVGAELRLGRAGNRNYRIVGVFEAGGGALESEIWAPRTIVSDTYNRRFDSSVVMRLAEGASARAAIEYINGSVVQLEGKLETAYYEDLAVKTREIVTLTTILVGIMAIGAVFAVANTMYAAVDGRRREIAMLRTIGFARGAIIVSFMIESILICTSACVAGLGASLLINGSRQDFLSDTTWTVLAYELRITPGILAAALGLATLVGVGGALAPALKASRTRVIEALRKA
jgi:putative ABC transport system permease protein